MLVHMASPVSTFLTQSPHKPAAGLAHRVCVRAQVSHHLLRAFLDWQWLPDSCQLLLAHSDQLTTLHMAAAQPSPESQQPQLPPGEAQPSPVLLEVSPGGIVAALFCSQEHCQLFLVDGSSGRQLHASRHAGAYEDLAESE